MGRGERERRERFRTSVVGDCFCDMKRVTFELGGKSPMIVCDDEDLDQAVTVTVASIRISVLPLRSATAMEGDALAPGSTQLAETAELAPCPAPIQ